MRLEEWKEIPGSEGLYFVSNFGRTKSFHPRYKNSMGRIRELRSSSRYPEIQLYLSGGRRRILLHRAVWETFIGPIPKGMQINHKDGDKNNSRLENLEVVTPSENNKHAYDIGLKISIKGEKWHRTKLKEKEVREIRRLIMTGLSQSKIASMFGVNQSNISDIKRGVLWSHLK